MLKNFKPLSKVSDSKSFVNFEFSDSNVIQEEEEIITI